jgi:hypothetical protein
MALTPENKASIDESAARWRQHGTNRFTEIMLSAPGAVSPQIDKLSSWVLGGTTATVVLLVTNAERVLQVLDVSDLQLALGILCLSGGFGMLAKVNAVFTSLRVGVFAQIRSEILPLLDELDKDSEPLRKIAAEHNYPYDTAPDVPAAIDNFIKALPRWWHWIGRRHAKKSGSDPLLEYRKITRGVFFQSTWTSLQVLSYIAFVLWVVIAIGSAS